MEIQILRRTNWDIENAHDHADLLEDLLDVDQSCEQILHMDWNDAANHNWDVGTHRAKKEILLKIEEILQINV